MVFRVKRVHVNCREDVLIDPSVFDLAGGRAGQSRMADHVGRGWVLRGRGVHEDTRTVDWDEQSSMEWPSCPRSHSECIPSITHVTSLHDDVLRPSQMVREPQSTRNDRRNVDHH